jgi:ligand-binding sensor domain-containing protein
MSCALTSGYSVTGCLDNTGGVREVYLMELGNLATYTEASGVITALTKATGKRFWKYQQIKETSEAFSEANGNEANGTLFFNQTVSIVLNKLQTATRNEIILLASNLLVAVVKDNNGKYWMYGKENGLFLTDGRSQTGKAMTDRNGYELTFTGAEPDLEIEVDSTVAAALETPQA